VHWIPIFAINRTNDEVATRQQSAPTSDCSSVGCNDNRNRQPSQPPNQYAEPIDIDANKIEIFCACMHVETSAKDWTFTAKQNAIDRVVARFDCTVDRIKHPDPKRISLLWIVEGDRQHAF
jgi:hypothetical protein